MKTIAFIAPLLLMGALLACGGEPFSPPQMSPTPTTTPPSTQTETIPDRDLFDLAVRFGLAPASAPRTVSLPQPVLGESRQFFRVDPDAPALDVVQATLRLVTDHVYYFLEDGLLVEDSALRAAGRDFEDRIYPQVTAAFGHEWTPGVDGDPHLVILQTNLNGAGGYYSSSDEYPRAVVPRSNEREVIFIDSAFSPGTPLYSGVVAHELQHLIHWYADPGEESWVNEGLSEVALELILGDNDFFAFLDNPDTQLNDWAGLNENPSAHYAGSALFFRYILGRFGGLDEVRDLLEQEGDGIAGLDTFLAKFQTNFRRVFGDWIVANYLDLPNGPYSHAVEDFRVTDVTTIDAFGSGEDDVKQFAADYLELAPPQRGATFTFDGSDSVSTIPAVAPDGGAFWWSNRGDGIDSRLTREVDLSRVATASLNFLTWFDIEEAWDYAYVAVSTDNGATWRALPGLRTTDDDPLDVAYGPGYTGLSGGTLAPNWLPEKVDLTPFAGKKILLRFEYVTDESTNLHGFAIDQIAIPEIGLFDDAETGGQWTAEGFRRLGGPLPQQFIVAVIEGEDVRFLELDSQNRLVLSLAGPATIVIAGATDGTTEPARYSWSLGP